MGSSSSRLRACCVSLFTQPVQDNDGHQSAKEDSEEQVAVPAAPQQSPPQMFQSLATSDFKRLYEETSEPLKHQHELFAAVEALLKEYAMEFNGNIDGVEELFNALQFSAFNCTHWRFLLDDIHKIAVVLWTSCSKEGLQMEFCSILNHVIRQGSVRALEHAVVITRAMNAQIVDAERQHTRASLWPANHRSYRGTSMPREELGFFVKGLMYRVPMFLATSVSAQKANSFLRRAPTTRVPVLFTFVLHSTLLCDHALFIEDLTLVNGEDELLYVPYSAFKVSKVVWPNGEPSWDKPVKITLSVQPNNKSVPEDVPNAKWH